MFENLSDYSCIFSGVAVFLPLITITLDGEAVLDGTAYLSLRRF